MEGLLAVLLPAGSWAQEKTTLVLGTATPAGGFPAYGAAFAESVNEADATLCVQPRNTRGSTENARFTAMAGSSAGARFIVPDAAQVTRTVAKHALLKPMTVHAGSYAGQSSAIPSVRGRS